MPRCVIKSCVHTTQQAKSIFPAKPACSTQRYIARCSTLDEQHDPSAAQHTSTCTLPDSLAVLEGTSACTSLDMGPVVCCSQVQPPATAHMEPAAGGRRGAVCAIADLVQVGGPLHLGHVLQPERLMYNRGSSRVQCSICWETAPAAHMQHTGAAVVLLELSHCMQRR
jgi:hypothetical protein